jgi:hypothetical protein
MDNYTFILPNDKAATYKVVTFIIAIINVVAFILMEIKSANTEINMFLIPMGISIMATPFINYFIFKRNKNILSFNVAFIMCGILWVFLGMILPGILLIAFSIFGFYTNKDFKLEILKEEIVYPSFPKKRYQWNEVEQIILKDNILTIDLKNNKLMQFTLVEKDNKGINENAFNDFCKINQAANSNK